MTNLNEDISRIKKMMGLNEQIGGSNDKAQADIFKKYPQNSSQQTNHNSQHQQLTSDLVVPKNITFRTEYNPNIGGKSGPSPYTITILAGKYQRKGYDKTQVELKAYFDVPKNGLKVQPVFLNCKTNTGGPDFNVGGAYVINREITSQFCSGPTPTQYQ